MFKEFEGENYTILNYKAKGMKEILPFLKRLNELYNLGYIIEEDFTPKKCPRVPMFLNVKFKKSNESKVTLLDAAEKEILNLKDKIKALEKELYETKIKSQDLEDITKKDDLLEYAIVYELEIPEDIKAPTAIKKYIKENIN